MATNLSFSTIILTTAISCRIPNVRQLTLDKDGNIVVIYRTTYGLFDVLNPESLELTTVKLLPENGIDGFPRLVTVNAEGEVLVLSISENATNIYQYEGGNSFRILASIPERHEQQSVVAHLLQLPDGHFLLNDSEMGLRRFSPTGELVRRFTKGDFKWQQLPSPLSWFCIFPSPG